MMMNTQPSSKSIANEFISLASNEEKGLTNMQLQKLVYFAQGYCLAILEKPLYKENIHAWQWGPVIPRLYKSLQKYGSGFVEDLLDTEDSLDHSSKEYEIIDHVWKGYKQHSGAYLSRLTHQKDSPWTITWENKKFGVIDPDLIKNHYQELLQTC